MDAYIKDEKMTKLEDAINLTRIPSWPTGIQGTLVIEVREYFGDIPKELLLDVERQAEEIVKKRIIEIVLNLASEWQKAR